MPASMPAKDLPERLPGLATLTTPELVAALGFSRSTLAQVRRQVVAERGWIPGTDLENQVMILLSFFDHRPEQQYKIGKFRIDFAWPGKMIGLEADGWWHRSPEGAAKDRQRDSWLRSQGWLIFRIDDEHGEDTLRDQLVRVTRFVRKEDDDWAKQWARMQKK